MRRWPARTVSIGLWTRALEHRDALMGHLQERWSDLFGAECQILLCDLRSTYFEGEAAGVESAARGYSRDHRPDTLQVFLALVVTAEGFPVALGGFRRGHRRRDDPRRDRCQDGEQVWDEGRVWCLIAEWSARTTCRIFGSVEPIIWWALHGANSPSSSASCLRATGRRSPGNLGLSLEDDALGPSASAGSPKTMSGFPPRWQVCTGSRSLS